MANSEVATDLVPNVEMGDEPAADLAHEGGENNGGLENIQPELAERVTFLDYLKSPIIELIVGRGSEKVTLHAHEALVTKSPWFAEQCARFHSNQKRRIDLPDESLDTVGSVLEYLYNGEYFPKRLGPSKESSLESDPSIPSPDDTGLALLRHARVYTLADKLSLPALKSLAHSKIHRTSSTAKGEIAYARYVYSKTSRDDTTIRRPVAAFWATRSHVLRHEAEMEFRAMCLEFPEFGFDVLTLVLDQKEKRGGPGGVSVGVEVAASSSTHTPHSGRKRARVSHG